MENTVESIASEIVEHVVTKVTEDQDKFIFETIRPYCEEITQQVIDKKTLSQALIKHFGQDVRQMGKCPNCNRDWHLHPQYVKGLSEIYCHRCGMKIVLRRRIWKN